MGVRSKADPGGPASLPWDKGFELRTDAVMPADNIRGRILVNRKPRDTETAAAKADQPAGESVHGAAEARIEGLQGLGQLPLASLRKLRADIVDQLLDESAEYRALVALDQAIELLQGISEGRPGEALRRQGGARRAATPGRRRISHTGAAAQVIAELGHPVPISMLLELVAARGAIVGGQRPASTLASSLSQDPRFSSIIWHGQRSWWLSDQPVPPEQD
jgi:hypothetical protein